MITIGIMAYFGHKWGSEWVKEGYITETEMLEAGYIGCFFAKIFGGGWIK